jgi:hypothetical protein
MNTPWIKPGTQMPEKDQKARWPDSAGGVHEGLFVGRWMHDNGLCIYYNPTFWQLRD